MASADWLASWPGALRDEPLARHSQYGIGGAADWFVRVSDPGRLGELLHRCSETGVPVTVVGAGSNTLILDGGVRGLVVKLTDRRLRVLDGEVVELSGGYLMPRAALDCARRGIAGLEFGIGIPGTCGASVRGNAGAFGTEIGDVLVDCDALAPDGSAHTHPAGDLGFAYRDSRFKHDLAGHIVVAARLRGRPGDPAEVRRRTDAIQASRKATQPYGQRSLGSMFTNPPGDHAGRLVEAAGLKGRRIGGAEISPKHANFVVNQGGATAADVLALAGLAQRTVEERFGVRLELEIAVIGEAERSPVP
ncbi:MAG: UDP-N-acetylmuramate dehydrogenase [Candidatus Dormibacteria bacterium]|jgi:UDP-N-acetylmuramate dehydrogenase